MWPICGATVNFPKSVFFLSLFDTPNSVTRHWNLLRLSLERHPRNPGHLLSQFSRLSLHPQHPPAGGGGVRERLWTNWPAIHEFYPAWKTDPSPPPHSEAGFPCMLMSTAQGSLSAGINKGSSRYLLAPSCICISFILRKAAR